MLLTSWLEWFRRVHITPSTDAEVAAPPGLIRGKQSLKASTSPLIVLMVWYSMVTLMILIRMTLKVWIS